jgi:hypothetical protein
LDGLQAIQVGGRKRSKEEEEEENVEVNKGRKT